MRQPSRVMSKVGGSNVDNMEVGENSASEDLTLRPSDIFENFTFDSLGCMMDCGSVNSDDVMGSAVMRKNIKWINSMVVVRKEVADYAYFMSENSRNYETFVYYSKIRVLMQEQISSMEPGVMIDASVIDCWAMNLNYCELLCNPGNLERFLFTCNVCDPWTKLAKIFDSSKALKAYREFGHAAYEGKFQSCLDFSILNNFNAKEIDFKTVKMFFFPLISGQHYTLYVVNMETKQLQYLDNMHPDIEQVTALSEVLLHNFSKFLVDGNYRDDAAEVKKFKLVKMEFEWMLMKNTNDCGVYLMKHMHHFRGGGFSCPDLLKVSTRHKLRAEIIASLCLSEVNKKLPRLMSDMEEFIKKKHYYNDISTTSVRKVHGSLRKYYDKLLKTRLEKESAERKERINEKALKDAALKEKEDDDFATAIAASLKTVGDEPAAQKEDEDNDKA